MTIDKKTGSIFSGLLNRNDEVEKEPNQTSGDTIPAIQSRGPCGKRSDRSFEQVTAYIRKNTHKAVKIALLQEGKGTQFSELVEQLLDEWLTKARTQVPESPGR